jgi:hypothetical protein
LLSICVLVSGCAIALLESNATSQEKLRIACARPEEFTILVAEKANYPVPPDGRTTLEIPRLPSGCATYLLGARVAGESIYDAPAIRLKRDGRTVRKLSLDDLAKLPVDEQGFRVLKVKRQ